MSAKTPSSAESTISLARRTVLASSQSSQSSRSPADGGGPVGLVEEQAVTSQAFNMALNGGVGGLELKGDLSKGGAGEDAVEEGLEDLGAFEPVGEGEGL